MRLRSLRRTPGFTITAIVVAALGIGATTATFSIADHVLLRPLPFRDADRLVRLTENHTSSGYPGDGAVAAELQGLAADGDVVRKHRGLTAAAGPRLSATVSRSASSAPSWRRAPSSLLGRQAAIGTDADRTATRRDAESGRHQRSVVANASFAGDPNVLGSTLTLDSATLVIVGVMPPDFYFPAPTTDYWRVTTFNGTGGRQPRQQLHQRDGAAEAWRDARAGASGDGSRRRANRAAVSEGADRQERQRAGVARRHRHAVADDAVGAGRRRAVRAADRVHQPGEPADVARDRPPRASSRCAPPSARASIDSSGR